MNCLRLLRILERKSINVLTIPSARCVSQHPIKFIETQNWWKKRDNVSKEWQLIYKAPMDTILNCVTTYLTVSTSTIGLAGLYYSAFIFNSTDMNSPVILGEDVVIASSGVECLFYLGAFITFHLAVKILLSKYVIRIYQHDDNYIAIFRGHIFNSVKKHKFHLKDFVKLNPTFVVSWGDARFDIGKKHAIILENYFKTPEHFNYLLYKKSRDNPNED